MLTVSVAKVDWTLLRKQKMTLIEQAMKLSKTDTSTAEDLDGIIHLIDDIQDQAETVLGAEEVFGQIEDDRDRGTCPNCGKEGPEERGCPSCPGFWFEVKEDAS